MLVQICGLPGAGKSTLASAIADATAVVSLRADAIEAAMWKYNIAPEQSGIASYSIMHAIAGPHLRRGQTVVADAVSSVEAARAGWAHTAAAADAKLRVIEVVCPDAAEHRRRVERRDNDLPGFTLPTWEQVERVSREYEPRDDDRLVIDSTRALAGTVADALAFIDTGIPAANVDRAGIPAE
ncbi:MAG: AAA family ATPase [Actinomycetota bacterium]